MTDRSNKSLLDGCLELVRQDYHVTGPMVLDAADFGAATARKRVFVVGVRKAECHRISEDERLKVEHCNFASLDFIPADLSVIEIEVPKLTSREMRALETQLPRLDADEIALGSIPAEEAEKFVKFYRYFPNYAVLEN